MGALTSEMSRIYNIGSLPQGVIIGDEPFRLCVEVLYLLGPVYEGNIKDL